MTRKYTLTLTKEDIEQVLRILAEKPFNVVSPLILEIAKQIQEQKIDGDD
jgi:hypothetical protein